MSTLINFIGAGPGSPDLLTLRGRDLIAEADVVLYAGSLVPEGVLVHASAGADIQDSAPMALRTRCARSACDLPLRALLVCHADRTSMAKTCSMHC